ncbi:MAG: hypothetical protein ACYCUM_10830 [Solirubrobacteraceae bacterium]
MVAGALIVVAPTSARLTTTAFRRVAQGSVEAFATDGEDYAAWQKNEAAPVTIFDTRTGKRSTVMLPMGCSLQNSAYGSAYESAAAGRFLVSCGYGADILEAETGHIVVLPRQRGAAYEYLWVSIGSRYVYGTSHVLYDIASRQVRKSPPVNRVDLNAPSGSTDAVCPRLRRRLRPLLGREETELFAFTHKLLANSGHGGNVLLDRCEGAARTLHALKKEQFARNVEVRGGFLTWNTGLTEEGGGLNAHGRLYAYNLATHRQTSWALPVRLGVPTEERHGTFGYSSHTKSCVFWLADAEATEGGAAEADRWVVYAAKLPR